MNCNPDAPDEQVTGNDAEESGAPETLIHVLTGADVRTTPWHVAGALSCHPVSRRAGARPRGRSR